MKHFRRIQSEFSKIALTWDDLSINQQKKYLNDHPKSKRKLTAKPKTSIEKNAVKLLGSIVKKSPFKNKTFLAGGYVRDKILGRPSKDIDIVVAKENGGIDLATYISNKLGIREPVIFPTFGTAKIQLPSGLEVEFVQTRNEEYMRGSRKPRTSFGTLNEDIERRDFTINTLLYDLTNDKILDLTGRGLSDLKKGLIKTPLDPNETFKDDPLRMLRAIRFATKYGFEFDENIIPAIKANSQELRHISKERIQDEFNKMLLTKKPSRALEIMRKTGLLKEFLPELLDLVDLEQGRYHYTDAWGHTMAALDYSKPDIIDRLSALLHDIGKPAKFTRDEDGEPHFYQHEKASADMIKDILKNLKYSNDIIKQVAEIAGSHMRIVKSDTWRNSTVRRFIHDMGPNLEKVLALVEADRRSHHPKYVNLDSLNRLRGRIKEVQGEKPVDSLKSPLSGNEIMKILNIDSGPLVGKIKNKLQDELFENPKMTKEEAINFIYKN